MRYSNRGIGTYTRNLIRSLLEIDEENEYTLLTIKGVSFPEKSELESRPNVRMFGMPIPGTNFFSVWVFDRLLLSTIIRALQADVIHFPAYEVTDACLARTVITVHDLIGFKERLHRGVDALVSRNQLAHFARCVKGAAGVTAVSNSTRDDLVDILGIPRDRISVTYPGIDPLFAPVNDEQSLSRMRRQLGVRAKHLLYAGSCARNKRVDLIIRAYSRLDDATKKDCQLVMCGFVSRELEALAADLHLSDHVVFAGIVSRGMVSALYNSAAIVLFPSDAEGFGLPVLEAMACGTPVIATRIAPLVEVGRDAVLFVEPGQEAQLSRAIATLLENPHLRRDMSQRGLVRAKEFSWKNTAAQTLKLYESVASQHA
jgi:glycosyltransferase involved in cell wall biosynthesis